MKYPIAPNGIFTTIQGEGTHAGEPMIFLRLAGCSVGCALCDTDYRVDRRLSIKEIVAEIREQQKGTYTKSVWITGGEPFDHDVLPLVESLREIGMNLWFATSGHKDIPDAVVYRFGCCLSVSPHNPTDWKIFAGDELKIIPGLAGYRLTDFMSVLNNRGHGFRSKWVCPCDGVPDTVQECRNFVVANRGWRMGGQLHKAWNLP